MAWWKGLLYAGRASDDAWSVVGALSWPERQKMHRDACTLGLGATVQGRPLREMARDLAKISRLGLSELRESNDGPDETEYLTPIDQVI